MVAAHHGRVFEREYVREICSIGRGGVSLLGITEAAERVGLRSLAVNLSFKVLREEVPMPCIAHWEQNHFVVVCEITRDKVVVADPASGRITYSHAEFCQGWLLQSGAFNENAKGILLLLETTPHFFDRPTEAAREESALPFLFSYLRPHKRLFRQLGLGVAVVIVLDLIFPFLTQSVVDLGIGNLDLNLIHLLLLGQLMLVFSQLAIDVTQGWILFYVGTRISTSLVADFLHKLLKLPLTFFDTRTTGDIMQRIQDHRRVNTFMTSASLNVVFSIFTFLTFSVILGFYDLGILAFFVGLTGLSIGWIWLFLKRRRHVDQKRFAVESRENDKFIEMVSGVQEIKIQGLERQKRWEWEELSVRRFKINSQTLLLKHGQRVGATFIGQLRNLLITYLAARAVIQGHMTLGMMLSTQYIVGQMASPIQKLIDFIQQAQDARLSLERMQQVYSQREEEHWSQSLLTNFPVNRTLALRAVSFRYAGAGQPNVLSHINVSIPEGKVTAIVGASGSGKTTLLKLLLSMYKPSAGAIYIGGNPLAAFDTAMWRRRCGVVMQDGFVFPDTIRRNITCTTGSINPLALQAAIHFSNLTEFIQSLPQGAETKIGGDGQGLSGGQKQRILIARAIYKDPEYLFLDEATSALDSKNEHVIMENLREFASSRTVVIIAHRLSTVRRADQIIVMDGGEIVEHGSHADLVHGKGIYFRLVRNQLELEETTRHAS